ncbi:MAG: type II toxin-antitoxin system prevent-host-death family antitoxin [Deltaproteobacteria bacterium]|nr:type II toxin-antitoxin system prevent-host-death family antitoxin [Deltaproteobacteria bacterium]
MIEVNVKEARSKLSELLNKVEKGQEIIITRRGKKVARLVSTRTRTTLPSLKGFRKTLSVIGKPMSEEIIASRKTERY